MVIDVSDTGNGSFFDLTTNVSAIMPPHQPRIVVYLELEIIGGSSKLGIQALSKLDLSDLPHTETPSKKDGQYKTYTDYVEDMILHNCEKTIPEDLTPVMRREFLDLIRNDLKVRQRFVSRRWPRPKAVPDWKELNPPPYQIIDPENSDFPPGKTAPNGITLWGSTLLDFYRVEKIPGLSDERIVLTGSKLLGWCKANGEYDNGVAKQCISWAEDEKDPEVVPVYNIANLIRELENSAFSEAEEQKGTKEDAEAPDAKGPFVLPQPVSDRLSLSIETSCSFLSSSGLRHPHSIQPAISDHGLMRFLSARLDLGVSKLSQSWKSISLSQGFRKSSSSMIPVRFCPQMAVNGPERTQPAYMNTSSGCLIPLDIPRDERKMRKTW
jgi:hypothetical protein